MNFVTLMRPCAGRSGFNMVQFEDNMDDEMRTNSFIYTLSYEHVPYLLLKRVWHRFICGCCSGLARRTFRCGCRYDG